jgi:HEAT repeat protein
MWSRIANGDTPWQIARDEAQYPLKRLLEAAHAVGRPDAVAKQRAWLTDTHDGVRYWAAVGFRARSELAEEDRVALRSALMDQSAVVRIEAAAALSQNGEADAALPTLATALHDDSLEIALHAARALELLGPAVQAAHGDMKDVLTKVRPAEDGGDTMAMFIRFSLEAALK